jgi:adenylate cyclase
MEEFIKEGDTSLSYGDFVYYKAPKITLNEEEKIDSTEIKPAISEDKTHEISPEHDQYYELADKSPKTKHTISAKLISITSLIVVAALGIITTLVSYYVTNDVRINAEENNLTINSRSAADIENRLESIHSNVYLLLDMIDASGSEGNLSRQATAFFFERNPSIAAVIISDSKTLINTSFFISHELENSVLESFVLNESDAIQRGKKGEIIAVNASPYFDYPMIGLIYPYDDGVKQSSLIILFSSDSLSEIFGTGSLNSSFMVNNEGELLAHPDNSLVMVAASMIANPIVKDMMENSATNRQLLYTDESGEEFFGAYKKISQGDIGVITTVQSSVIFETVHTTTRRNVYLTVVVLAISIMIIWFVSKSISNPVKALAAAANQIKEGKYELSIKAHTKDELGLLTESFVSMGKGLAERERLKDTFGRFINKEIAEKALKGELTLGGETKTATIFFSDIRSFTAISEKLEPYEVVGFLNDYMTRMVNCVTATNGVVDKFIGDAVMAVWGAPVSAGTTQQDALNCVRSALMMRSALIEFNKGRGGDKKPIIRIGCGINTGPVVAGQIGSNERMEYTVIGDAVNFASRTESLNKPLGTDILITENTYELVKEFILAEEMPSVTVKGKEKPVKMFAVLNMLNVTDIPGAGKEGPKTLKEVRLRVGIPEPDMGEVNLDAEEKKYEIQGQ